MNLNNKIDFLGYSSKKDPAIDIQDGFIATGPDYGNFDDKCKLCKENNVPYVVRIGADLNFLGADQWKEVDENTVEKEILEQLQKYLSPCENGQKLNVFAWTIHPEELRPWRRNEMNYLRLAKRIIRKYSRKPIIHYNPNNRDMNHLSILIDHGLDIVAKNAYVSFDSQENRSKIIGSVQEASKAVEAKLKVASSLVTGVYLQLAIDPSNPKDDSNIKAIIRHDVFLSVVCGAKAIIIWSLFKRKSVNRTYDLQYDGYITAMKEINEKEIQLPDNSVMTLSNIFLNSKKKIEHSSDLMYTRIEYEITNDIKFLVCINSSNKMREIPDECTLEPFEVKYNLHNGEQITECSDVAVTVNSLSLEKEEYSISEALNAFKIISKVIENSEVCEEADSDLLLSLKTRLHKESEFE